MLKKTTKSNISFKQIYFWIGLIALIVTIWTIIHNVTNVPAYHGIIKPGSPAAKFQKSSQIQKYFGKASILFYFTILSNLVFSVVTFFRAFFKNKFFSNNLQLSVTTYMIITAIIFWTTLSFIVPWNDPLLNFEQIMLHLINPILSIVIITKLNYKEINIKKSVIEMTIFPIIYYIFTWILYLSISGQSALYPFLNYYHPFLITAHWFWIVCLDLVILVGFFIIFVAIHILTLFILKRINLFQKRKQLNIQHS